MKISEREMAKSAISGQNPQFGTGTKKGWYRYPLDRGKVVPVPIKVVPIPIHQKRAGTSTDQSGTSTDASNSPDFLYPYIVKPQIRTPII